MCRFCFPLAFLGLALASAAQETWTYEKPSVWARDKRDISFSRQGDVFAVEHAGQQDWALSGFGRIAVSPGDIFETSCSVKVAAKGEWASAETGVILRDAQGHERSWGYGGASAAAPCGWTELKTRFIVPKDVATIEPRLTGHGAASVGAKEYRVVRAGRVQDRVNPAMPKHVSLPAGAGVTVDVDCGGGCFAVADKRSGRTWSQALGGAEWLALDAVASADGRSVTLSLLNPETTREIRATVTASPDVPEVEVVVASEGSLPQPLNYPPPFETRKGDRLIVPMNEGMGFPVDEPHPGLHRMIAYGGHGICMGFFGAVEDASGAGWMCVLETPDDAAMDAHKGPGGLWVAGPSWDATRGEFGYARKARYVFFGQGGPVALCKRYRAYAKQVGLFKPFTEKVKANPNIDLLIGAANIWSFSSFTNKVQFAREMQAAGMGRLLWSGGGSAEELAGLNALTNVLSGRYDIYQDIMDPANFKRIGYVHPDWTTEAFPRDINWAGPSAEQWRHGWKVKTKDGSMIPCAVICDAQAVPYARKRIGDELKAKPYRARFIDTTVAAPWYECFNPDHPMTRSDSRRHKMELLALISGEFKLVCGSETGHEASVPFCDYYEGMLSVGPYRVDDAGRNMAVVLDEVPERVAKYQVGEAYRLPLWELVYHDCVVAQWYWGDYNNKLPKIWHKRDLFNALYGTPPMYMLSAKQWAAMRERFVASYKVAQPVARATGYSEMVDFRVLTPDRQVQQSVFANGVTVTVNFGASPYALPGGRSVAAADLLVEGL